LQDRVYYSTIVKLNGEGDKNSFTVFPNPAKNIITISGQNPTSDIMLLNIYDASGRIVKRLQWQQPQGAYSKSIPVDELVKGVYWVEMKSGGESRRLQVVKQ